MIFAAIAVAWLAYLVPHFVRRRDDEPVEEADPVERFSDSVRIVRHGTAPLLDQDLTEIATFEVSTPQTRRAAVNELRRLESLAALRRRRVLLGLMAVLSAVVGVCAVHLIPWWTVAVPGGLMVGFFVIARVSVSFMRRSLDARYRDITQGSDEKTVFLSRKTAIADREPAARVATTAAESKLALWDPVPITVPTYVSKPLAPRTVRTIDLSGPDATPAPTQRVPVIADAPLAPAKSSSAEQGDGTAQAASA